MFSYLYGINSIVVQSFIEGTTLTLIGDEEPKVQGTEEACTPVSIYNIDKVYDLESKVVLPDQRAILILAHTQIRHRNSCRKR